MRIFIFIGQFGNEIGCKLLNSMGFNDSERQVENYFAIMIDTEKKVIAFNKKISWQFHCAYEEIDKRGRGSNWAMGYHLNIETSRYSSVQARVNELVRRKLEAFSGKENCSFVIIHSLIGGTGGGLGSSVLESIREEFPNNHITSVTVGPFVSGESPLQHYNSLLTLAWLQRFANCVMVFHNDDLINNLSQLTRNPGKRVNSSTVSLNQMNESICYSVSNIMYKGLTADFIHQQSLQHTKPEHVDTCQSYTMDTKTKSQKETSVRRECKLSTFTERDLASVTMPIKRDLNCSTSADVKKISQMTTDRQQQLIKTAKDTRERRTKIPCTFLSDSMNNVDSIGNLEDCDSENTNSVLELLTPYPSLKFVSSVEKQNKEVTTEYKPALLSVLSRLPKSDPCGNKYKNLAAVLIARGNCFKVFDYERQNIITTMNRKLSFHNDLGAALLTSSICVPGYTFPQSLTLHSNNNRIADYFEHVIEKATIMYSQSAYLHWYTKFGCTKNYFDDAFETLSHVVQEYKSL